MIWKTLREEKPEWRKGSIFVLTRGNKIVSAWFGDGKFWNRLGRVRPISYKRWCYEKDLVDEILASL